MRAGDTGWEELPTEYLGVSDGFLSYRATLPEFSTFVIVGVPGRAANLTATPVTMPEVILTTTVPTTTRPILATPSVTATTPAAAPTTASPVSWLPVLSLVVVVLRAGKKNISAREDDHKI
jgi:hypothetical protein